MSALQTFLVQTGNGGERLLQLPPALAAGGPAPARVVAALGRPAAEGWVLLPAGTGVGGPPRLLLARPVMAAAPYEPRLDRLKSEWEDLRQLNMESDTVKVEPVGRVDPVPLQYVVHFFCQGIVGIEPSGRPKFAGEHRCRMTITQRFPTNPPDLLWETDIWHPNIGHVNHLVCIQEIEWLAAHRIRDLCRMLFEMVQYKNYHALNVPPYPRDGEVAKWVREVGEPNNYVNKGRRIFADDKPFTRPLRHGNRAAAVTPADAPRVPQLRVVNGPPPVAAPTGPKTIRIVGNPGPR
jgi:ubiquitin-protein ligase